MGRLVKDFYEYVEVGGCIQVPSCWMHLHSGHLFTPVHIASECCDRVNLKGYIQWSVHGFCNLPKGSLLFFMFPWHCGVNVVLRYSIFKNKLTRSWREWVPIVLWLCKGVTFFFLSIHKMWWFMVVLEIHIVLKGRFSSLITNHQYLNKYLVYSSSSLFLELKFAY